MGRPVNKPWANLSGSYLDSKGRCCGRKPLLFQQPVPHYFCFECDRAFDLAGNQIENWAWKADDDGLYVRRRNSTNVESVE